MAGNLVKPLLSLYGTEPVFVDLLRRLGIDSQTGGPVRNRICRTGPPEPVFVDLLRRPGIDSQLGGPVRNPICRTGPPSYIGWRNRFLGIDSQAP